MPSVKDTHFHFRLLKNAGTKNEWDALVKLAEQKGVKSVLNSFDDDFQDIHKLLARKLNERPIRAFKASRGKYKTYLIIGCIHRPHHSKVLWSKIMQLIKDLRKDISGIIINGDYLEMESISSYGVGRKGSGITLADEYEDGLDGLLEIEAALGKRKKDVEKFFLWGNHEYRWQKSIDKLEISKYGDALLNPIAGLRLDELGYQVQMDYQNGFVQLGENLEVFHGQYFNQHAAAKHLKEANGKSVIFNHTHRYQTFSNNLATAYNIGCLINLKSKQFNYAHRHTKANWKNAFALAYIDHHGEHVVNPIECVRESFFIGGKKY